MLDPRIENNARHIEVLRKRLNDLIILLENDGVAFTGATIKKGFKN